MRNLLLMLLSLCFICYPTIAQDFPDGLIAYTLTVECETLGVCPNGIRILNPNTGDATDLDIQYPQLVKGESLSWSPDQRYFAYSTVAYTVEIFDTQTFEQIAYIEFERVYSTSRGVVKWHWHPSEPLMVFMYQTDFSEFYPPYELYLFDLKSHEWIAIAENTESILGLEQWSPDGQSILFRASSSNTYDATDFYLYNISSGAITNLTQTPAYYGRAKFSSDGDNIVYTKIENEGSQIFILDIDSLETKVIYEQDDSPIGRADWVLDESAILFWMKTEQSDYDIELYLLDLHTNDIDLVTAIPRYFSGYDISPNKTALVYLASEEHEKDVCIVSLITLEETCLEGEKAYMVSYPAWGS